MSLAVAFKGPEGIVLAADSRVTLTGQRPDGVTIQASYDNATKLFSVDGHKYVGVVTHGAGAFGQPNPRTINSYRPELEESLEEQDRLSVKKFAKHIGDFFTERWNDTMPEGAGGNVTFLVGGYNEEDVYGRVYKVEVPENPEPDEQNPGPGNFGVTWGGQLGFTSRLLNGFEPALVALIQEFLSLSPETTEELHAHLKRNQAAQIPYQFLPLQDCVDLSRLLIHTTIKLQEFLAGTRGVGGPVDVAIITRKGDFQPVQKKEIVTAGRSGSTIRTSEEH